MSSKSIREHACKALLREQLPEISGGKPHFELCWSSRDPRRVGFHQQRQLGQDLAAEPMVADHQLGSEARSADPATWKGWSDCIKQKFWRGTAMGDEPHVQRAESRACDWATDSLPPGAFCPSRGGTGTPHLRAFPSRSWQNYLLPWRRGGCWPCGFKGGAFTNSLRWGFDRSYGDPEAAHQTDSCKAGKHGLLHLQFVQVLHWLEVCTLGDEPFRHVGWQHRGATRHGSQTWWDCWPARCAEAGRAWVVISVWPRGVSWQAWALDMFDVFALMLLLLPKAACQLHHDASCTGCTRDGGLGPSRLTHDLLSKEPHTQIHTNKYIHK